MRKSICLVFAIVTLLMSVSNICIAGERSPLADKLVAGSPWLFTTPYENTEHKYRYSPEGDFERWNNNKNKWVSIGITEDATYILKTKTGHTITLGLDKDGKPTATHSKHSSTFRSMKDDAK